MKNHTKNKTKLLRVLAAVSAGGFLMAQQAALLSANVFAETIETPVYGENTKTLADIDTMQEMTQGVCDRTPDYVDTSNYASKQLTDTRDGKSYWVAKLADGNCWMTQNLALEPTMELTSENSNVTTNTTLTKDVAWSATDTESVNWQISTIGSEHTSYGGYYTWQAATANTAPVGAGKATGSICPKGWILPLGDNIAESSGSFRALTNAYGATVGTENGSSDANLLEKPLYFVRSGFIGINGLVTNPNSEGRYWSSTAHAESDYAYNLYFTSSGVYPADASYRYNGFAVRCVNNPDTPDTKIPEIDNPNVIVTVPPVLTMTLTESVDIDVKSNAISTGNFVARVTSNAPYTISLSATQNGHTDLRSTENGSIPASDDIKAGESGWGIKCIGSNCVNDSGTGILNTRYNALTEYGTPKIYFDSPSVAANQETSFEVGIGVNASLASGTYATDVLVTAAQK